MRAGKHHNRLPSTRNADLIRQKSHVQSGPRKLPPLPIVTLAFVQIDLDFCPFWGVMRRSGSVDFIIRIRVTSRLCANTPDHRTATFADLVRLEPHRYRPNRAGPS
jgi:hypothetical protein